MRVESGLSALDTGMRMSAERLLRAHETWTGAS